MRDDALVCTLNSLSWYSYCNNCDTWRLLVWKDGGHAHEAGYIHFQGITVSTKAGKYYGGLDPCAWGDNFPLCGEW